MPSKIAKIVRNVKKQPTEIRELIAKYHYDYYLEDLKKKTRRKKLEILCSLNSIPMKGRSLVHMCVHDCFDFFIPFDTFTSPRFTDIVIPFRRMAVSEIGFDRMKIKEVMRILNQCSDLMLRLVDQKKEEIAEYVNFLKSTNVS